MVMTNRKFRFWLEDESIIVEEKLSYIIPGSKNKKWDASRVEIKPAELQKIINAITPALIVKV